MRLFLLLALLVLTPSAAVAEDGHDLWLRYRPLSGELASGYRDRARSLAVPGAQGPLAAARDELEHGLKGLLGAAIPLRSEIGDGAILVGTPATSPAIRGLQLPLGDVGSEGFLIRSATLNNRHVTIIAANSPKGALYGAFAFLRLIQTGQPIDRLSVIDKPRYAFRMLDHWDNLDRTVERGYAGGSLWDWETLPRIERRYVDYARADASVGINSVVLNNVNADPKILTAPYLEKVAALAGLFRPYGIRLFLTARFSSPIQIGGLPTADPADPAVQAWWRAEADEIYRRIPDFGGFLVKANSEGQPGPQDYGRSHAEGANVIADALAPHGGTVFYRAFVYSIGTKLEEDRAKQAYDQFKPLDGRFHDNVVVQAKNGPIDFQPREPFHPLFGQMPKTKVALEVQLTREYLGQGDGVAFLAPMWSEVLDADTCSPKCGNPVSGSVAAIAGVSNAGMSDKWTGTDFDQANWYAFGRLAWNPDLKPDQIAGEWARMTWSNDPRAVEPIVAMMLRSREAAVDYMTPLGLAHQMATDYHYGPGPWVCDLPQASWNPCSYNGADVGGIGVDRTASGSNAVAQYAPGVARRFADLASVPDDELLWFHHLPWTYRMQDGRTLWDALVGKYDEGVGEVEAMRQNWASARPFVDPERFQAVSAGLDRQLVVARWWRNASIAYWQSLSKLPLPQGHPAPPGTLDCYKGVRFETVPGFLIPKLDSGPKSLLEGGQPCAN